MITIDFNNLIYFVPQYIASSILAIVLFLLLQKRFKTFGLRFRLERSGVRDLTKLDYLLCSKVNNDDQNLASFHIDHPPSKPDDHENNGMCSPFYNNQDKVNSLLFDLALMRGIGSYMAPATRFHKSEIYDNHIIYSILASIYAISAWIGVLLILTPYDRIAIFIPHFSSSINLIVAIILGIFIFEATISIIVYFVGNSRKWFFYISGLVFIITSLFFFSPSMSWIYTYSVGSRVLIYFLILGLILFITFLIFQLESRKNSFLAALYSSGIAYGFFIATVAFNIYIILSGRI